MKNNKFGKIIINLIAIMLVVITSIGMIVSYKQIDKIASRKEYNYFESYEFIRNLSSISYNCLYDISRRSMNNEVTPYDILVKVDRDDDLDNKKSFNSRFESYSQRYLNLEYFGVNTKDKVSTSNIDGEIKVLENGDIDISSINKDYYQFYVVINYDDLGRPVVKEINGADKSIIQEEIYDTTPSSFGGYYDDLVQIKNINVLVGVPKALNYYDNIAIGIDRLQNETYGETAFVFPLIGAAFIMISALLMPYNKAKQIIGFKFISKIKFEIGFIMISINIGLTVLASMFMVTEYMKGTPARFVETILGNIILNTQLNYVINYAFNFIVWSIIFAIYFYATLVLKHIFKVGFKNYFIESTITGGVIAFAFRYTKKTIKALSEVDLSNKNNKLILKIVAINAVILSFICLIWFFGIIGVVIYSVVIFFLIRKYADEISSKYRILTDATKKIAEGNLDVKINEDLGVFEPLKDDLERIQSGFKKAVEEEVKSQKMKTELISNVSHDLKTPLTSIITYIDLLKVEDLSEEKRKQYLDTLDRKSQRLQYLIEDLFEVSKASSGNINLNIESVDVVSLMKQTILELEDKIQSSSLVIKSNFKDEKIILQLDSFRTFRVFENLLSNITKYAMNNTRVYIDIIDKNDFVEITLKNIAAEEIKFDVNNIVERFVRGDESRNTEGSGLGLAIAKSFVELQGGSFNIEVDGDLFKVIIKLNK